jgi:hypothetical protein
MPSNILNEDKWEMAKKIASKSGHKDDWDYINSIYQKMGGKFKNNENLNRLYEQIKKEAGNTLTLNNFLSLYKNAYKDGQCEDAAKKVAGKVKGFEVDELNTFGTPINSYIGKHFYATDGNKVVDLTFPFYAKKLIDAGVASDWWKNNKLNNLFGLRDYLKNFVLVKE